MTRAENINPSILAWARETAGLTIEEAADRLSLSTSEKSSAVEKLVAFEAGETKPTRNQLLKIASLYRRPLTTFYKNDPPEVADRGEDFRTLAGPVSRKENALLDALLRDVRARQDLTSAVLEDDDDISRLDFIGTLSVDNPILDVTTHLREALGIQGENWAIRYASPDELFADLRDRVENLGVFVLPNRQSRFPPFEYQREGISRLCNRR